MSLASLLVSAGVIKNETALRANTASRIGSMFEDIINALPLSHQVTLTQAQVRTLNTENSGSGIELLPPPGVGKAYVISNPIYKWIATGGSFTTAELWLYYKNEGNATFISDINGATITPITYLSLPYSGNNGGLSPSDNIGINLRADVQQELFEGTLTVSFDYKIVDFN